MLVCFQLATIVSPALERAPPENPNSPDPSCRSTTMGIASSRATPPQEPGSAGTLAGALQFEEPAGKGAGAPKTWLMLTGCALWLAVLGWIDRATGFELGLFAFYTAPVAVVAWRLGQAPGIIVAFVASVIWYLADRYAGDRYSTPIYGYWNTGMHFTTFLINAVTFAKIKSNLDQRHALERELKAAREQLKQLVELAALCPQARQPFVPEPPPRQPEV